MPATASDHANGRAAAESPRCGIAHALAAAVGRASAPRSCSRDDVGVDTAVASLPGRTNSNSTTAPSHFRSGRMRKSSLGRQIRAPIAKQARASVRRKDALLAKTGRYALSGRQPDRPASSERTPAQSPSAGRGCRRARARRRSLVTGLTRRLRGLGAAARRLHAVRKAER